MVKDKPEIGKKIIVTTFGGTWEILPEIIGFCHNGVDIFKSNKAYGSFAQKLKKQGIITIDELWIICTHGQQTDNAIGKFVEWTNLVKSAGVQLPEYKFLGLKNITDLTSEEECKQITDFIFRVVLKAHESKGFGKLLLSLAGGRKTMSSDMQRAAFFFGCNVLFHLADSGKSLRLESNDLLKPLENDDANAVFPLIIQELIPSSPLAEIPHSLLSSKYPVEFNRENSPSLALFDEVNRRLGDAQSISFNAYKQRTSDFKVSIFHGLHQLNPAILKKLEKERPVKEWIKRLPKTDLHCHFGGILDINGLIRVAKANNQHILEYLNQNKRFKEWYDRVCTWKNERNIEELKRIIKNKRYLREHVPFEFDVPQPIPLAAFVSFFEDEPEFLETLLFGNYIDEWNYRNVGIDVYETLGDMQGSGLLQSKESIVEACGYLVEYCNNHNILYLELRCSPANYTKGGLSKEEVVSIMHQELQKHKEEVDIRLIVIGSRHGDEAVFSEHVNLVLNLKQTRYREFIVGFDVAGNEAIKSPKQLRELLHPLMKECVKFTIHAGENQPVENIWEAVYELNADRIGHGLTLVQNKELLYRFRDRNIFIELCPSSNHQICDFSRTPYPLREYMNEGLKITVNTDNPGISRTDITEEYFFSSKIAGLTKMEIIQLIRNSVQGTFLPKVEKKKLMLRYEEKMYEILRNE